MKFIYFVPVAFLLAACTPSPNWVTRYMDDHNRKIQNDISTTIIEIDNNRRKMDEDKRKANEARYAEAAPLVEKWLLEDKKRHEDKMTAIRDEHNRKMAAIEERERQADELAKKPPAKIGMSAATVREKTNWGVPKSVNRTTTNQGVMEQWVYEGRNYLYFRNGKLYAIQN